MKKGLMIMMTVGLTTVWAQQLTVNAEIGHVKCFGDDNGTIELNITGGQGPYQINWAHGESGSAITGLAKGQYGVQIKDVNDQATYKVITIDGPDTPITITGNSTNLSAFNANDGSVSAAVTGGSPFKSAPLPYTVEWSNNVTGTYEQNNLSAGIYVMTVTDRNACVATKQFKVMNKLNVLPVVIENPVKVYPNPSTGNFKATSKAVISEALLIDIRTGQTLPVPFSGKDIDVQGLSSGEYQLMILNEEGERTIERVQVIR